MLIRAPARSPEEEGVVEVDTVAVVEVAEVDRRLIGAKGDNLRQELDELATVLTPAQLQKFKDLSKHKKNPQHVAS